MLLTNDVDVNTKMDKAYNLVEKANDQMTRIYMDHVLFTWQWWSALFLCVVPWTLWIIYRKKASTWRLLTSGMFVIIISSWMDFMGASFDLWHYHYDVIPSIPSYEPWDFTLMPVTVMFLLQIRPSIHPLIKAAFFGIIAAFAAEPFFTFIGLYHPEHWKMIYSFPIYVVIYLIAHVISTRDSYKEIGK